MLGERVWEEGIRLDSYKKHVRAGTVVPALSYGPSTEEAKAGQTAGDRRKETHACTEVCSLSRDCLS